MTRVIHRAFAASFRPVQLAATTLDMVKERGTLNCGVNAALEARLFPASTALTQRKARRPMPEWASIHRELKRPGVTLLLLWEEYRGRHPDGLGYSLFCEIFQLVPAV